jgi:hypothetical protein
MPRPDTYDSWQFIQWVLEQGEDYYVKIPVTDPETKITALAYVPIPELPAALWVYWVKRWFVDRSTPVRTAAEWTALEEPTDEEAG